MSRRQFGARGSYAHRNGVEPRQLPSNTPFIAHVAAAGRDCPHQSAVAGGRQSAVASRQSSVDGRQSPVGSRQSSVGSRQSSVDRSPIGRRSEAVASADPAPDRAGRSAAGTAATDDDRRPRRRRRRLRPRRLPIAPPRLRTADRRPPSERPRTDYPTAAPRDMTHPASVPQPAAPAYQPAHAGVPRQPPAHRRARAAAVESAASAMPRSAPPPASATGAAAAPAAAHPRRLRQQLRRRPTPHLRALRAAGRRARRHGPAALRRRWPAGGRSTAAVEWQLAASS